MWSDAAQALLQLPILKQQLSRSLLWRLLLLT